MSEDDDGSRFDTEPTRSSRDRDDITARLAAWLKGVTGDPGAVVADVRAPSGSGMSSETLLFDATWAVDGAPTRHELVARIEPDLADTPVFRSYDLQLQFDVMRLVGDHTDVPVPTARWIETDPAALGGTFFVMDRVDGRVPADIPPYVFGGWLLDASPEQQAELETSSIEIIAGLSTIDVSAVDVAFLETDAPGASPLDRHVNAQRDFYDWVCNGERRHRVIDDAFAWLDANRPHEGPPVVSWGDARIGNVMYEPEGFRPVAVLDWEMASLAPVEIDLGWMAFLHQFFQNIAEVLELPGLPNFMHPETVRSTFTAATGTEVGDLHWFQVYAAVRHAIIMSRITDRSVRFGEKEWPDDIDSVIPHRDLLVRMIS